MITKHREQGLQMAELTINADDVRNALNDFAASYEPSGTDRTEVGRVISAADGIARVEGLPSVMANELLRFENGIQGLAQNLDTREIGVVVLGEFQEIREGIKAFSNWPTIPQIYVKGEFVGGCDITREMFQSGELQTFLSEKGVPVKTAAA